MLEDKGIRNGKLSLDLLIHGSNEGLVHCAETSTRLPHLDHFSTTPDIAHNHRNKYLSCTSLRVQRRSTLGHHAAQDGRPSSHLGRGRCRET